MHRFLVWLILLQLCSLRPSDAALDDAIGNMPMMARPILEKQLEKQLNHNNKKQSEKKKESRGVVNETKNERNLQYDFARTVKLAPHSQPECRSGTEFLSPDGGSWEKSDMIKDKFMFRDIQPENYRVNCYRDDFSDHFVWAPNCSIPILEKKQKVRPQVLLVGDSLTEQIATALLDMPDFGMDIELRWRANLMLSSVKYESRVCTQCQSKIESQLYNLMLYQISEADFIDEFSGYDYIIWNEYAHYVGKFMSGPQLSNRQLTRYYDEEAGKANYTKKDIAGDALSYFERQINRKAELLRLHMPNTKVYYRTSPPHNYQHIPGPEATKGEILPEPAWEPTYEECIDLVGLGFGIMCYAVLNELGREAFLSKGHEVLETGPAISQRADSHQCSIDNWDRSGEKDCLHFCMPGPPNIMLAAIVTEVLAREKEKL